MFIKKTPQSIRMRGLRCPVDGYALPAVSPKEKQLESQRKNECTHSGASCCNVLAMSTTVSTVTPVTKQSALGTSPKTLILKANYVRRRSKQRHLDDGLPGHAHRDLSAVRRRRLKMLVTGRFAMAYRCLTGRKIAWLQCPSWDWPYVNHVVFFPPQSGDLALVKE